MAAVFRHMHPRIQPNRSTPGHDRDDTAQPLHAAAMAVAQGAHTANTG